MLVQNGKAMNDRGPGLWVGSGSGYFSQEAISGRAGSWVMNAGVQGG